MAKSGNNIHGTLRKREPVAFGTKAFLVDMVNENGWSLEKGEIIDAGEWNRRRQWFAINGDSIIDLGSTLGGMDWKGATYTFCQKALAMTSREVDEQRNHWQ